MLFVVLDGLEAREPLSGTYSSVPSEWIILVPFDRVGSVGTVSRLGMDSEE